MSTIVLLTLCITLRLQDVCINLAQLLDSTTIIMAVRRSASGLVQTNVTKSAPPRPPIVQQNRTIFDSLLTSALGTCEQRNMSHSKVLPHPASTVFKAVSDVGGYPSFLPFTISANVKARDSKGYPTKASLKVGYAPVGVEETWESVVRCDPTKGTIEAKSSDQHSNGLFESLSTKWQIQPSRTNKNATAIKLNVSVKFLNPVYDQMFAQFEHKVADRMISAFEARVQELQKQHQKKP
jgi:coenzyme Q-binding protein COQ10